MEKSKAKEKVKYVDTLDKEPRDRYLDKIRHLKGTDPYEVRSWSTDPEILPPLSYPDIVTYLVLDQSAYTTQEFKRFKSLEAHVKFTNGWVQDIKSYTPDDCQSAYWMVPSAVSEVEPEVGYKIDFTTAAAKKKAVGRLISGEADCPQGLRTARLPRASTTSAPTEAETEKFLRDLHRTGDKAL
nr:hypothetical protein BaRGS_014447 [Batillaria attramentaria]